MNSRPNRNNKANKTNEIKSNKRTNTNELVVDPASLKKQKTSQKSLAETGWETLEIEAQFTYLESDLDKPGYVFVDKVNILNELDQGYGLYAADTIPAKTIIGQYTGKVSNNSNPDSHYSMELSKNSSCDAEKYGNFTRFANYSEHQDNLEFVKMEKNKKTIVAVHSKRNINKNEQLLVNYNTFNEDAASKYYYLNTDDSWKSSSDYYQENKSYYKLSVMNYSFPALNMEKGDDIYFTNVAQDIINSKKITELNQTQLLSINMRILKSDPANEKILEFKQFDTINALMMACYLGQINNVNLLLSNGVELNKQQTITGRSALFFAIQGVKDEFCTENECLDVILTLIKHKAKIYIQDNKSELFLFSAVRYLSSDTVDQIINELLKSKNSFKKIAGYVNEENEDIFYLAIKNKRFDTLNILLKHLPSYVIDHVGEKKYYSYEDIKKIIINYTDIEITQLKKVFDKHNTDTTFIKFILQNKRQENYIKKLRSHNETHPIPKQQNLKLFDYKCPNSYVIIEKCDHSKLEIKRSTSTRKHSK